MSADTTPTSPPAPDGAQAPAAAQNQGGVPAGTPAAAAMAASGDSSSATSFGSLGEMREKAPKVYDAMMKGIAMTIINEMKDREEERKKIAKEYDR